MLRIEKYRKTIEERRVLFLEKLKSISNEGVILKSMPDIASALFCSERTVERRLKHLRKDGLISIKRISKNEINEITIL